MRVGVKSLGIYPEKERTREQRKLAKQEEVWTLSKLNGEDSQVKVLATLCYSLGMSFRANYPVPLPLKLWHVNKKLFFPLKSKGFLLCERNQQKSEKFT